MNSNLASFWRSAVVAAVVWLFVGTGTAAAVSTLALLTWALLVIFYAALPAALLGTLQGVWIAVDLRHHTSTSATFWACTGALLGFLGFPLAFAASEGTIRWWRVGIFVLAAILGGAAAGYTTAALLLPTPRPARKMPWFRLTKVSLLLLCVAALEWWVLWPKLDRRFPTPPVAAADVNIPPGTARGSAWSGCFTYQGESFGPSSGVGVSGGSARFAHENGRLKVVHGLETEYLGSIDADGRFRVAREAVAPDGTLLRQRLEGRFLDHSRYRYSHRATVLNNGRVRNTIRDVGTGWRRPC